MNKKKLLIDLTTSLQTMYDMEVFASMIEFCQGEMRVLLYLYTNYGCEIYPSDLSNTLNVTRQRITSILSSLRKKGYVSMEISENDRRKMRVSLTKDAKKPVIEKLKELEDYYYALLEGLGEENTVDLTRLINLSIEQMKQYTERNKK